ncbi:DUF502 domain-containing protein [Eikenella sp. S3360]|uniref:DUF502 domain-containing protein n=1 Tax=Eikenella glucosivorans TaxID=2766967 RepID=A0ABS0NAV2_9NEIS|nr:DUF502 domain-containing protein [Eikenella glucosivorans]MBH5329430.1 DUF502 domain-containing protein [Eikenella glucosivorans]
MSEHTPSESSGIGKAIKRYLITGLLVWLPITITLWVVTYIVSTTDHLFNLLPSQWQPESYLGFNIPGLGFIFAIVVLFITGVLGANVLGRKVIEGWDSLLGRIPVVKSIYSSVKKVSESLLSDNSRSFKTPVLVPFPQPDIWTIAFVSGSLSESLLQGLPENTEYVSVYVPTTPNPTGGYYIFVRKQDIRPLAMSVDEALKYVISLGMVAPNDHKTNGKAPAPAKLPEPAE